MRLTESQRLDETFQWCTSVASTTLRDRTPRICAPSPPRGSLTPGRTLDQDQRELFSGWISERPMFREPRLQVQGRRSGYLSWRVIMPATLPPTNVWHIC